MSAWTTIRKATGQPGLPALAIPLCALALAGLWVADWRAVLPAPGLVWCLHVLAVAGGVLFIVVPAGRSFLAHGQPSALMLGCGIWVMDLGSIVMPAAYQHSASAAFAIYNTSLLLGALCHLAGVVLSSRPQLRLRPAGAWLAAGYGGGAVVMGLVIWAGLTGRMPVFFIDGQGGTPLRTGVLGASVVLFFLTAGLLWQAHRRTPSPFLHWYALGLALLAIGMTGGLAIVVRHTPLQWGVTFTQLLGTAYLCMAALTARRAGGAEAAISLEPVGAAWRAASPGQLWRQTAWGWAWRYGSAVVAVVVGLELRVAVTAGVGPGLPAFITFYPAVMVVAMLAGFGPGLLATALSALVAAYWILPPDGFAVESPVGRVGLVLFSSMGLFMSLVAEFYQRSRDKAATYDRDAARRESGARYRALFEGSLDGVFALDRLGHFVEANPAVERLAGLTLEQARARNLGFRELCAPDRLADTLASFEQNLAGVSDEIETAIVRPDGQRVELLVRAFPMREGDAIVGVYVIASDITLRKATEQAARQSAEHQRQLNEELEATNAALATSRGAALNLMEDAQNARDKALAATAAAERERHLLRTLIDLIPDAIFVRDAQDRFLVANIMMTRAAGGSSPEAMLGKTDAEFFPANLSSGFRADDQRVLAGETLLNKEERVPFPGLGERILLTTKVPFRDRTGAVVGLAGVARDITERHRAEAAVAQMSRMLAEAQMIAHLGSFEYIAATQSIVWSVEEYRIYGLDPAGPAPTYEVMLAQCIHPEDAARLHQTFAAAMQSRAIYELEHRIVRPDGSVRFVHDRAHPYCDEHGRLIRYVGATLDITERKQMEEELRASNEELSRFNQLMVGRENRMIDLKKEANGLCARLGLPRRYPLEFEPDQAPRPAAPGKEGA